MTPTPAPVYNLGGSRESSCSVIEAVRVAEQVTGNEVDLNYSDESRVGDHIWWIGSNERFTHDHPSWAPTHDVRSMIQEVFDGRRAPS